MPLDITCASNSTELFATLQGIDISVPRRIDGRSTDQTETQTIARLLSTLAMVGRLAFPLSVTHRDRPDILVQAGNAKIGVEITEAIPQQYAGYCALAEREFPGVLLEPAHFRWGAPSLTVGQMRELLRQSQLTSDDGWVGDYPEQEWALSIQSAIDTKLAKLTRTGFAKFDQNWLAVYDNLPNFDIDLAKAIGFLHPLLKDRWPKKPGFDVLFVEHGSIIARITAEDSEHLVLNDLWK